MKLEKFSRLTLHHAACTAAQIRLKKGGTSEPNWEELCREHPSQKLCKPVHHGAHRFTAAALFLISIWNCKKYPFCESVGTGYQYQFWNHEPSPAPQNRRRIGWQHKQPNEDQYLASELMQQQKPMLPRGVLWCSLLIPIGANAVLRGFI